MASSGGQCLCGALNFRIQLPSLWMDHCHCSLCQRAHGAGVVTWVGASAATATIEDPGQMLRWYASSPGAERGFCGRCGSTLFFRSQRWPGELHIVRANFTEPLDREPQLHVHFDTHATWLSLGDALPREPAG